MFFDEWILKTLLGITWLDNSTINIILWWWKKKSSTSYLKIFNRNFNSTYSTLLCICGMHMHYLQTNPNHNVVPVIKMCVRQRYSYNIPDIIFDRMIWYLSITLHKSSMIIYFEFLIFVKPCIYHRMTYVRGIRFYGISLIKHYASLVRHLKSMTSWLKILG